MSFAEQFKPTPVASSGIDPNREYAQEEHRWMWEMLDQTDLGKMLAPYMAELRDSKQTHAESGEKFDPSDLLVRTAKAYNSCAFSVSQMLLDIQQGHYISLAENRDITIRQVVKFLMVSNPGAEKAANDKRAQDLVDAVITDLHVYHDTLKQPTIRARVWDEGRRAHFLRDVHVSRFATATNELSR